MFLRRNRKSTWRRAVALIIGLALIAGIANLTRPQANNANKGGLPFTGQADSQLYSEDIVITKGDVFDKDVFVYAGDVQIEAGGLVKGDLVVYSGDINMDTKSAVQGDVTALSGDTDIAGTIGGDLVVLSGNVFLAETAAIDGGISVMSGEIERESGAIVRGNVVAGGFKMPSLPAMFGTLQAPTVPALPAPPIETAIYRAGGWGSTLFGLIGRLIVGAFGASLIILLAGLVYYVRPTIVSAVQQTLDEQRPLSFAVGFIINLVLVFLTGVLMITLCLAPVGLAAGLLFAGINLIGWAAVSLMVGQWLLCYAKIESQPLIALLVGASLMTGVLAFGWSIGGCLRPLTYLASLAMSAFGGGAVVVYWLRLHATPKAEG